MKVLIIEDEQPNADLLRAYLKDFDDQITIVGHTKSKQETRDWFQHNKGEPDLVFCDIELLDGNVFTMLRENIFTCPVIFTTAYNHFYQEAFDVNGIAYLLKPVSYKKFVVAMQKYRNLMQSKAVHSTIDWSKISDLIHQKKYRDRLVLKDGGEISILSADRIAAILSNEGKCMAIDDAGNPHHFRGKISDLILELNPQEFFRINRGEIININFIEKIESYIGDRLAIRIKNMKGHLITSAQSTPDFRKWLET